MSIRQIHVTSHAVRKAIIVLTLIGGAGVAVSSAPQHSSPALNPNFELDSTVAFVSGRDDPAANPLLSAEIYLMNGDGTNPRRITSNADGDGFPALSPDGKKIVFDSNRLRGANDPLNTSDLFVMA